LAAPAWPWVGEDLEVGEVGELGAGVPLVGEDLELGDPRTAHNARGAEATAVAAVRGGELRHEFVVGA
jgi:hypothetical protein